jgi:PTH1 family peptidyl-tRNA hydrolase
MELLPFFQDIKWQNKYKGFYADMEGKKLLSFCNDDNAGEKTLAEKVRLIVPETFMNLSGESIYAVATFFKIEPEKILLVHDELELPLGTASFKFSGGLGGHNGLRSMKACFNTADFWRLRIGIGRPGHSDVSGWVLSNFTSEELLDLKESLSVCAKALINALIYGAESLLPEWNKKKIIDVIKNDTLTKES